MKYILLLLVALIGCHESSQPQVDYTAQFIKKYASYAKAAGFKYNVPPSIILASAIVISSNGDSHPAISGQNFFNICPSPKWDGPTITIKGVKYKSYPKVEQSFADFAYLIDMNTSKHVRVDDVLEKLGHDVGEIHRVMEKYKLSNFDKKGKSVPRHKSKPDKKDYIL